MHHDADSSVFGVVLLEPVFGDEELAVLGLRQAACTLLVALAFDHKSDVFRQKPKNIRAQFVVLLGPLGVKTQEFT